MQNKFNMQRTRSRLGARNCHILPFALWSVSRSNNKIPAQPRYLKIFTWSMTRLGECLEKSLGGGAAVSGHVSAAGRRRGESSVFCSRNLAQCASPLPGTLPDLPDNTPCRRLTAYHFLIPISSHRGEGLPREESS